MKNNHRFVPAVATALALFGGASAQAQNSARNDQPNIVVHLPNPYAPAGPFDAHPGGFAGAAGGGGKMSYHGGPVMGGTPNAYVIWYGGWTDAQKRIIRDFLNGIGGSPYFNINKTYSISGTPVTGLVNFSGEVVSTYAGGTALTDQSIQNIVAAAGPTDLNGVYFVLTGTDITKDGFCTSYCGWHTYANLGAGNIKYSFVGNPSACPLVGVSVGACAGQTAKSPNGDVGVDAMVSVLAHELEEAVTDPELNAWFDLFGYENADKCAWKFGTTPTDPVSGAYYNVSWSNRKFLVQMNWLNVKSGSCAIKY